MIEPIEGKFEDLLVDCTGAVISPSIITFAFKGVENIESSQVAQIDPGKWELRVVPAKGYSDSDGAQLIKNFRELVSRDLVVRLVIKKEIARTNSGKYRWIVNESRSS